MDYVRTGGVEWKQELDLLLVDIFIFLQILILSSSELSVSFYCVK